MRFILTPPIPMPNLKNIKIAQSLVCKNILDFECFIPISEAIKVYADYNLHLEDFCRINNLDYTKKLRELCEIITVNAGMYELISPRIISNMIRMNVDNRLCNLWKTCVSDFGKEDQTAVC